MARVRGLTWMRTSEAIRSFVTGFGHVTPRRALFCTFDLDVSRFEEALFPELTRRGRQFRTMIMADAGALQMQLAQIGDWRFKRYQVAPIRCRRSGVFHPKLVVLVAGPHYLVGVGSANVTAGGLGGNLELMLFCSHRREPGAQLASGAREFLESLLESEVTEIPRTARQFVELLRSGLPVETGAALLHSLTRPLLPQMVAGWNSSRIGSAVGVDVLSPWHSGGASPDATDPEVIQHLRRAFDARVSLYTDGHAGRGPDLGKDTPVFVRSTRIGEEVATATPEDELERRPTRVHAKAYLISGQRGGVLFFGSANCTQPALLRAVVAGGNVELLVACMLDDEDEHAIRYSLEELFTRSEGSFVPKPSRFDAAAQGVVLCGNVREGTSGPYLEIEAPEVTRGTAIVSASRIGRGTTVAIRDGRGEVREPAVLSRLFRNEYPHRAGTFWGAVLWERAGNDWVPFPVFVPVVGGSHSGAAEQLEELAMEEFGVWPAEVNSDRKLKLDGGAADDDLEDDDALALDSARHQGQLDRLAVATSRLRRRIVAADHRYRRERLKILRDQIAGLDLRDHVRRTLLNYIARAAGKSRK